MKLILSILSLLFVLMISSCSGSFELEKNVFEDENLSKIVINADLSVCSDDIKLCSDGSYVNREGPNCEFFCPPIIIEDDMTLCENDIKICPDGSSVGRLGLNCEFTACPEFLGCTKEAKICPDGSSVERVGPNCEFAACPEFLGCTLEAKICPDGSSVERVGSNCEFAACPNSGGNSGGGSDNNIDCGEETKLCSDGSFVKRGGSNCEFVTCSVELSRPSGAGVASIWSKPYQEELEVVRVIQAYSTWEKIQAIDEFTYNFESAYGKKLQRAIDLDKYIYLQINMPAPSWMKDKVAVVGYQRGYEAYQFWDPDYMEYHFNLIKEFAKYIENHPAKDRVLGIRIQPNAYNTEVYSSSAASKWEPNEGHSTENKIPLELWNMKGQNFSTWISQPPGFTSENPKFPYYRIEKYPGSNEIYGDMYMKKLIDVYVEAFHPLEIGTSLRISSFNEEYLDELFDAKPLMQCLQTSAETSMLLGLSAKKIDEFNKAKKYCREKAHLNYWEGSGEKVLPTWEMEIYWRDLMRLEAGGTWSATRMDRWDNGEGAQKGLLFANKYSGYQNLPILSPGAWMVFIDEPGNNINNMGFFIRQVNFNSAIPKNRINDDYRAYWAKEINFNEIVYFDIEEKFALSSKNKLVNFEITWFSKEGDAFEILLNNGNGLQSYNLKILGSGLGTWKTDKISFQTSANAFSSETEDFAIRAINSSPILHMVEIIR